MTSRESYENGELLHLHHTYATALADQFRSWHDPVISSDFAQCVFMALGAGPGSLVTVEEDPFRVLRLSGNLVEKAQGLNNPNATREVTGLLADEIFCVRLLELNEEIQRRVS